MTLARKDEKPHSPFSQINGSSLQYCQSALAVCMKYFTTQLTTFISKHLKLSLFFILVNRQKKSAYERTCLSTFLLNSIVTSEGHSVFLKCFQHQLTARFIQCQRHPVLPLLFLTLLPIHLNLFPPTSVLKPTTKREDSCILAHQARQVLRH